MELLIIDQNGAASSNPDRCPGHVVALCGGVHARTQHLEPVRRLVEDRTKFRTERPSFRAAATASLEFWFRYCYDIARD
jgi:hypothetical protein